MGMIIGYLIILLLPLIFVLMIIGTILGALLYMAKYRFVAFVVISIVSVPVLKVLTAAERNPVTTKIVVGLAGLALAGVAAWYLMPAGDIFAVADKAAAMDISRKALGEQEFERTISYEDKAVIQQAVDSIDNQIYKPVRTGMKTLSASEEVYYMDLKDDSGNKIGMIAVIGDKYLVIADENGKTKRYVPYFYSEDNNHIPVTKVVSQLYQTPVRENIENIWEKFMDDLDSSFSYDDEKITFTMPAEPEGEYKKFGIKIKLVVPYKDRKEFIEVLNIRDAEKVPGGQIYQFDMPDRKLMFISIDLTMDGRVKPIEIKHIPAKYKYTAKKK